MSYVAVSIQLNDQIIYDNNSVFDLSCFWLLSVDVITRASCLPTHVSSGYGKLASMPAGGAVAVASSAAGGAGGAAAPAGERCSLAPCLSASITLGTCHLCLHLVR